MRKKSKHPEKAVIFSLTSLVLPITCERSGYKQNMWNLAIYNFMATFQLYAKGIFAVKVIIFNAKPFVHHSSMFIMPLALFFIHFISELVTLYPFVQMKLSPMLWRLQQMEPTVIGNLGNQPFYSCEKI